MDIEMPGMSGLTRPGPFWPSGPPAGSSLSRPTVCSSTPMRPCIWEPAITSSNLCTPTSWKPPSCGPCAAIEAERKLKNWPERPSCPRSRKRLKSRKPGRRRSGGRVPEGENSQTAMLSAQVGAAPLRGGADHETPSGGFTALTQQACQQLQLPASICGSTLSPAMDAMLMMRPREAARRLACGARQHAPFTLLVRQKAPLTLASKM